MTLLPFCWPRASAPLATALFISCMSVTLSGEANPAPEAARENLELMLYAGGGKQPHTEHQKNTAVGIDLHVYRHIFTEKQSLFIGTGVAQLTSNTDEHKRMLAFSIYPQLNLALPKLGNSQPYFYVRTLGPTYLSETQLGERKQANHFVFQSQLGLGIYFGEGNRWLANIAYRHYSNARLSSPNDGIDALVLLTLGGRI